MPNVKTRNLPVPVQLKKGGKFLAVLRQVGNVTEAARLAKIPRNRPYDWARQSEEFAEVFAEARQEGHEVLADRLERELTKRATDGVVEAVYYKGQKIGEQRHFSDTAAIVMLKSLRPTRFVEPLMTMNVAGQQVTIKIASFASLASPAPVPPVAEPPAAEPVEVGP